MEPINIFSRIADPAGVAKRLREIDPSVQINGRGDKWTEAIVTIGRGKQKKTLSITHDPNYYAEPNWSRQMNGMQGYFSRFPETERKEKALLLITTFRFAPAASFEPDYDPDGDARLILSFRSPSCLTACCSRYQLCAIIGPYSIWFGRRRRGGSRCRLAARTRRGVHCRSARVRLSRSIGALKMPTTKTKKPSRRPRNACGALALTAVTVAAILEQDTANREAKSTYKERLAWVNDLDIDDEFEPDEWKVLQRPLGKLDQQAQINATWRLEGLGVLAWSLGRFEIPPHDQLVSLKPLWRSLGSLDADAAKSLLAKPKLRSRQEIAALRNRLFAIHWRLRNYHIRPEVMDFADFARTCWFGPLDLTGLPLIKGDLALQGKRIDKAPTDVFSTAHSASQERHQAANWLWEGPEFYSEASVAT